METLRYSLHEIWRQLVMWNIEAQCAAWAEGSKNRVEKTYQVGGFVMVHRPLRVKGAATRLLHNWVGPFRVATPLGHKQYELQHTDRGNKVTQSVSNMGVAPGELYEGEYAERALGRVNLAATPPPQIKAGGMAILMTPNGLFPAEVEQVLNDNTVLIYFWNGQAEWKLQTQGCHISCLPGTQRQAQGGLHVFAECDAVDAAHL
jgi:hypothetical protein